MMVMRSVKMISEKLETKGRREAGGKDLRIQKIC